MRESEDMFPGVRLIPELTGQFNRRKRLLNDISGSVHGIFSPYPSRAERAPVGWIKPE